MPWNKISASIRLIMAMFRLYAGIEESWGKTVKDILRKQYPDAKDEIDKSMSDTALGQKMLAIAMKQTQYNEEKAQDAIQSLLMYWTTGTQSLMSKADRQAKYEEDMKEWTAAKDAAEKAGKKFTKKQPTEPRDPKPVDFAKTNETWRKALDNMFSNVRSKAMSSSMSYTKDEKMERSIDQAYGQRGEEGGAKEGGEGRMPTPDAPSGIGGLSNLGQALDDKAGVLQFVDVIDKHIGDLKDSLPEDQRKLFDLIFEDDIGSFGSDIQENMNQATAMKEKYPELYEKNQKRWSGFVGDLRKKLLASIWDFIDTSLPQADIDVLWDTFFSDTTPEEVRKKQKEEKGGKLDYQRGLDERKLAKWKWQEQQGALSDKDKAAMDTLKANMTKRYKDDGGVDFDAIPAVESPNAKDWKLYSKKSRAAASFSLDAVTSRVVRAFSRTGT